jgi:putative ABC transport system permease protein
MKQPGMNVERSRLTLRDLAAEALAGILQRPGRTSLTILGTILGVGAFVAILGLTATAGGQISRRFTALAATEVSVEDVGRKEQPTAVTSFPEDADQRVGALNGVRHAGVYWPLPTDIVKTVHGASVPGAYTEPPSAVIAASPGMLRALRPTMQAGGLYNEFHDSRVEHVAVLGIAAARLLNIHTLATQPAIFVDDIPFTVVGIIADVGREVGMLSAVILPRHTGTRLWGDADQGVDVKMIVDTDLGAAPTVARQIPFALRPEHPTAFKVTPPPDPRSLRNAVSSDLNALFLVLAAICLIIGTVGIANTTLVAVLERTPEIGLRRALGARPIHIAGQFLTEAAVLGSLGGLLGTCVGVVTIIAVAAARQWTPLVEPLTVLPAPLLGALTGLLAGLYPASRAARVEPVHALQR